MEAAVPEDGCRWCDGVIRVDEKERNWSTICWRRMAS